jgi:hypothetical protein
MPLAAAGTATTVWTQRSLARPRTPRGLEN